MELLQKLLGDARALAQVQSSGETSLSSLIRAVSSDGYLVLAAMRIRQSARRWHIPLVNRALRLAQMAFYGIEIAKDAELGEGVNFMHTLGVVIGGDAKIGARTIFLGDITIGNLENRGYPSIGSDVIIGAGARILGPVVVGDGARIGANAVVLTDVAPGATAVGVPAKQRSSSTGDKAQPAPE